MLSLYRIGILSWIDEKSWVISQMIKLIKSPIKWVVVLSLHDYFIMVPTSPINLIIRIVHNRSSWRRINILYHYIYYPPAQSIERILSIPNTLTLLSFTRLKNIWTQNLIMRHIFLSPQLLTPRKFDYEHELLKILHPFSLSLYQSVIKIQREIDTIHPSPVLNPRLISEPLPYFTKNPFKLIISYTTLFLIQ